jgi:hypothetical protein
VSDPATDALRELGRYEWLNEPSIGHIEGGELLTRLFPKALEALYNENQSLVDAFKSAPRPLLDMYRKPPHPALTTNEGLVYWLFETTLVYSIFKAWIPLAHTVWEDRYPGRSRRKIDLMVRPVVGDFGTTWGFEAKWCQPANDDSTFWLWDDAAKLVIARDLRERFVLAFWHSPLARWTTDSDGIRRTCGCRLTYGSGVAKLVPLYVGAVLTKVASGEDHYFGFAVLHARLF